MKFENLINSKCSALAKDIKEGFCDGNLIDENFSGDCGIETHLLVEMFTRYWVYSQYPPADNVYYFIINTGNELVLKRDTKKSPKGPANMNKRKFKVGFTSGEYCTVELIPSVAKMVQNIIDNLNRKTDETKKMEMEEIKFKEEYYE